MKQSVKEGSRETDFVSGSHSNNDNNSVGDVITGHMKVCGR